MNESGEKNVVVIAGPSGGGKNAILDKLVERFHNCSRLVTATTRAPRPGEKDGVDYHFFSTEKFLQELEGGNILEHRFIEKLGTHYGVYRPDLEGRLSRGEIVLAHLDIIGARFLKTNYHATTIFIVPDSFEVLEQRIRARNPQMSDAEIAERIKIGKVEVEEHAPEYDHTIVNAQGKLSQAVDDVVETLKKEGYTLS